MSEDATALEKLDFKIASEVMMLPQSNGRITAWPAYSTDISAAMQIVEKLRTDGWDVEMGNNEDVWYVHFDWPTRVDGKWRIVQSQGASLELAICRAALKAVETQAEHEDLGK